VSATDYEKLACAILRGATLDGLQLVQFDLHGADLTNASLEHTDLNQADLTGAPLTGATFVSANLTQATLSHVNAAGASFAHAEMEQSTITSANLRGANLTGADLTQADLTGSDLRSANLTGANLEQATLTRVKRDPRAQATSGAARTPAAGATGSPATNGSGSIASGSAAGGGDLAGHLAPYIIGGCVLLSALMIGVAVRRSGRTTRNSVYATGYPAGASFPPPRQSVQPPFAQRSAPSPTIPSPVSSASDADQPYRPMTSFAGTDWQPPVVADNTDAAQHVIEEPKHTKWFRD
jgi:hypothetical protein